VGPLAPEHVTPLVVYLFQPGAEAINGEVSWCTAAWTRVMDTAAIRTVLQAAEHGSAGRGCGP